MIIFLTIDSFLEELFPKYRDSKDLNVLKDEVEQYYTYSGHLPQVNIERDTVRIELDTHAIQNTEADYRKAVALCEKGKYTEAKPILKQLIEVNPTNSEYHRIMGQILSDEGDQEEAINYLIDALRWNPKNGYALLMMGNIYGGQKQDPETAFKYYDQALVVNPKDYITVNNIGGMFLKSGQPEAAEKYFLKAMEINQGYPQTHLGLSMVAASKKDFASSFFSAIEALKKSKEGDVVYQNATRQVFISANELTSEFDGQRLVKEYALELQERGGTKIQIVQDDNIKTPARIEFAENYDREDHVVRYKSGYPAVEHLQMHELVHLHFVLEARAAGANQLFISTQEHKRRFMKAFGPALYNRGKLGLSEEGLEMYRNEMFKGLNSQIYNAPIDLFIESYLYETYPELRAFQFISLFEMNKTGIQAVTDKRIVDLAPREILSKSRILNVVGALQFKELFGIDTIAKFKATGLELNQAKDFYQEFLEYRDDREPGEEYELVEHWGEDLKLNNYFDLVDEEQHRGKSTNLEALLEAIEQDPFDLKGDQRSKDKKMQQFLEGAEKQGVNPAVIMYMVSALEYFKGMSENKVKDIAMEIAMLGAHGISPQESYKLSLVPNTDFTGLKLLAYYYVSWTIAIPEMVAELGLPYEKEYEIAKKLHSSK